MKITDTLRGEHAGFRCVFEQIEVLLPQADTLGEIGMLAKLVEGMLRQHGAKEEELLFLAYDHVRVEQGHLRLLTAEHVELDRSLVAVQRAGDLAEAKRLFARALESARGHFQAEESEVFPAIERTLQPQTLEQLAAGASVRSSGETSDVRAGGRVSIG